MMVMMVLIALLLGWFFLAKVKIFAQSSDLHVSESSRILAVFSNNSFDQIKPGQRGTLRVKDQTNGQMIAVPLMVFALEKERKQAEMVVLSPHLPIELIPGELKGDVSVETAAVSPFSLVLRSTGFEELQGNFLPNPLSNDTGTR
jgi:hypothetical protein